MRCYLILGVIALLATLVAGSAHAVTKKGQIAVKVTVAATCTIEGGILDFGPYTSGQTKALDATGTLRLLGCPQAVTIALDGGRAANTANRAMSSNPGGRLRYQLFRNSARDSPWGAGASARQVPAANRPTRTIRVYGRILAGQKPPAGSYGDVVQVTMTF